MAAIAHSISFAVLPEGTLKLGEERLKRRDEDGTKSSEDAAKKGFNVLPRCLYDALELALTLRGIGWQYSHGIHVPKARRPSERRAYLKSTLISVLRSFLIVDFVNSSLEVLPGITPTSGTIFLAQLQPILRYTVSTAITIAAGLVVILGLSMWYDIASLISVGLLKQSPALWPPYHDEPWRMSSLHELWSKRWHQALRHTFLVYGGYPGRWLAGDLGMLFGTFLASGLFHEGGLYLGGGTPIDMRVILFFIAQAFGIVAEKLYRQYTGERIGGWLGFAWAVIFLVGSGQLCCEFLAHTLTFSSDSALSR